jgi:hypothetical protein
VQNPTQRYADNLNNVRRVTKRNLGKKSKYLKEKINELGKEKYVIK